MAEAPGAVMTLMSSTLPHTLAVPLCANEDESPHSSEENLLHVRSRKSHSATNIHNLSPPPQRKFTTIARCCSYDIVADSASDSENPDVERKVYQAFSTLPPHLPHSMSQPAGFYGSQDSLAAAQQHPNKKSKLMFHRKSDRKSEFPLHRPKNSEILFKLLNQPDTDLNAYNDVGDTPLHAIVRTRRKKRPDLLLTLLVTGCSRVDVNRHCKTVCHTALHLAVMEKGEILVKTLLTFGADVNPLNDLCQTPLDIAIDKQLCNIVAILVSVGGKRNDKVIDNDESSVVRSPLEPFEKPYDADNDAVDRGLTSSSSADETDSHVIHVNGAAGDSSDSGAGESGDGESGDGDGDCSCTEEGEMVLSGGTWREVTLQDFEEGKAGSSLYERLSECINCNLSFSGSFSANVDEAIALTQQQKELLRFRKTRRNESFVTRPRAGSRVLCLDGGGIRGLIQIEVLRQLELKTGRKVTEIFDWIVGTSTGAVLALGLVYGKKNLSELRHLYFKLKDHVFAHERLGFAYNTAALEKILKEEFGTEMIMSDVTFPKVLVTAVYKKTTQPQLHFFNNCFNNDFSKQLVWKVARYTSAAPLYFSEMDHYVDGGVLANNPCEYALTAINNFYRGNRGQVDYNVNRPVDRKRENVALVMSIGTGIFPAQELGNTDAQQFLFFGKHWFKSRAGPMQRVENLITLLTQALVESESVAENCQSRLQQKGIPFYRFNPNLDEAIPAGEINGEKLLNMIMQTRYQTMAVQMDHLVDVLYDIRMLMRRQKVKRKVTAVSKNSCKASKQ